MADELKPPSNPIDADGLAMMCSDCTFYRGNVIEGVCRGVPASPVMVGVIEDMNSRRPNLLWYYPPAQAVGFCALFRRDPDKQLDPLPIAPSPGIDEGTA